MQRRAKNDDTLRKVKVRLTPRTWREVQMIAAYLGLHIQDLVGWMITTQIAPIWEARIQEASKPDARAANLLGGVKALVVKYREEV